MRWWRNHPGRGDFVVQNRQYAPPNVGGAPRTVVSLAGLGIGIRPRRLVVMLKFRRKLIIKAPWS